MKKKFLLIFILIVAVFLRIFLLDQYPKTLYGDEQSFAWNAYNILKTGQDEYGNLYPLQFKAFEDYKAPIPVYLLVPFFKIMGMNIFSIRVPVVIFSVLTILSLYKLCRLFFNVKISLLSALMLAVSSWHIHLSRGYFESTVSLFFFITAIYYFFKKEGKFFDSVLSMVFFSLTLYSYFTPRILLLFFLPFIFIYKYLYAEGPKSRKLLLRKLIVAAVLLVIFNIPLLYATFFQKGLSRFDKLNESANKIVSETVGRERNSSLLAQPWRNLFHNKILVRIRLIKDNYFEHFSPNFLYIYGDNSLRYFLGNMGMFYLYELPFFIIGVYFLIKDNKKTALFFFGWFLLAPIPSALVGRPYALRSLAMIPIPLIFTSFGIYKLFSVVFNKFLIKVMYVLLSVFMIISLGSYLMKYYFEYSVFAATWWGFENKAALDYAKEKEKDYDNIFISNFYSGATLAYAVYNSVDPIIYRQAINNPVVMADGRHLIKLGKYYFGSLDMDDKRINQNIIPPNSLYIGRPEEPLGIDRINAPDDGRLIFVVYKT